MNLVCEVYTDNKPCPCMHEPSSFLGGPESKKIGFVAPILKFSSADISKTINMLSKHGTTTVNETGAIVCDIAMHEFGPMSIIHMDDCPCASMLQPT